MSHLTDGSRTATQRPRAQQAQHSILAVSYPVSLIAALLGPNALGAGSHIPPLRAAAQQQQLDMSEEGTMFVVRRKPHANAPNTWAGVIAGAPPVPPDAPAAGEVNKNNTREVLTQMCQTLILYGEHEQGLAHHACMLGARFLARGRAGIALEMVPSLLAHIANKARELGTWAAEVARLAWGDGLYVVAPPTKVREAVAAVIAGRGPAHVYSCSAASARIVGADFRSLDFVSDALIDTLDALQAKLFLGGTRARKRPPPPPPVTWLPKYEGAAVYMVTRFATEATAPQLHFIVAGATAMGLEAESDGKFLYMKHDAGERIVLGSGYVATRHKAATAQSDIDDAARAEAGDKAALYYRMKEEELAQRQQAVREEAKARKAAAAAAKAEQERKAKEEEEARCEARKRAQPGAEPATPAVPMEVDQGKPQQAEPAELARQQAEPAALAPDQPPKELEVTVAEPAPAHGAKAPRMNPPSPRTVARLKQQDDSRATEQMQQREPPEQAGTPDASADDATNKSDERGKQRRKGKKKRRAGAGAAGAGAGGMRC